MKARMQGKTDLNKNSSVSSLNKPPGRSSLDQEPSLKQARAVDGSTEAILEGQVERITFYNNENGYTVLKLRPTRNRRNGQLIPVVGNLPLICPGETLILRGTWKTDREYGHQFVAVACEQRLPATTEGILKYLGSGLIKGIGPRMASRIVGTFGIETLAVIEQFPERLTEVSGFGSKRVEAVRTAWSEQKIIKEVMIYLQSLQISTSLAVKIYKQYKENCLLVIQNNPYQLARDVFGIGFFTADKIARAADLALDAPERIMAGLLHALNEAADEGHCFLPRPALLTQAASLLELSADLVAPFLVQLTHPTERQEGSPLSLYNDAPVRIELIPSPEGPGGARSTLVSFADSAKITQHESTEVSPEPEKITEAVYLTPFFVAEANVARRLNLLLRTNLDRLSDLREINPAQAFAFLATRDNLVLAPGQRDAVLIALKERVAILTGGPGTGKTTSMRALLRVLTIKQKKVILAAPTGRAAKRLSEATGQPATTLHRLLELRLGGESPFNPDNPLQADLIIVDEVSMLDLFLMNTLLKAIAPGTHLLLVGDADQLPSVGPGAVLADLLAAQAIPSVHLTHIFRQDAGSAIITNAHRINRGEMPLLGKDEQDRVLTDFFFFNVEEAEKAAALTVELIKTRIPQRFGCSSDDIQALVPMHRGVIGVAALNEALQEALNPPQPGKDERQVGQRIYRLGDRVLQLRNNYKKGAFNGDMGVIREVNLEDQYVRVKLDDGQEINWEFNELDELTHAFATSIHKSQGSEYPIVVVPLLMQHYLLLERRLLYTAVTRARKAVILVGSRKALETAVRNNKTSYRFTALAWRLQEFFA